MRTRVIAEIGTANHSIEWAHQAVDELTDCGVWAVKWQMLHPDRIVTRTAGRYDRLPGPDTQHEAFDGALPYDDWIEVAEHVREAGMVPMASVWDLDALDAAVSDVGLLWIKIGSADITNHPLLRAIPDGTNVVLSTGASTPDEISLAVDQLYGRCPIVLMACTLSYPCDDTDAYLSRIACLAASRYGWTHHVGYSDHTLSTATAQYAVLAGAQYLEKHFTITPGLGGDHDFALDPNGMAEYVRRAAVAELWLGPDVWQVLDAEQDARRLARRSLWTTRPVEVGDRVQVGVNCDWLRPTGGIEPHRINLEGGYRFRRRMSSEQPVMLEDLERA